MAAQLERVRSVYEAWARHERLYALVRWLTCAGRESELETFATETLQLATRTSPGEVTHKTAPTASSG